MGSYDAIVAGGGVAGLSAALFLARAAVSVAVFDEGGSSLRRVSKVHNYLGFPDGVGGAELIDLGRRQARRFGAHIFDEAVAAVERVDDGFDVKAASAHRCRFFVLASNKRIDLARSLGLTLGGIGDRFVEADPEGATAVPGLFAAGRITGLPSQAVVSAGHGARVALAIVRRIRGAYYVDHDE